jgi:hypothetical protein
MIKLLSRALAVTGSVVIALPAMAASSDHCLLQVEGKTYIQGRCLVNSDDDGGLSVGTDGERIGSPYFALLQINQDGTAKGFWSAVPKSTHAQTPLGTLRRSGSCWENPIAKICAD